MSMDVIGVGIGENGLLPAYEHMLEAADVLAGGERILAKMGAFAPKAERLAVRRDIDSFCRDIFAFHDAGKRVVILADGDPLFFGVGSTLASRVGRSMVDIRFWPNISSLQAAASAMGIAWNAVRSVSLHGRGDRWALWRALMDCGISCTHLCILTGSGTAPGTIAQELLGRGLRDCDVTTMEMLGTEAQKMEKWSLEALATTKNKFAALNVLILSMKEARHPALGTPDAAYCSHGSLITKRSVRAAALAELRLHPGDILWDVGAGTGSVGIEATCLVRQGAVFAIECNAERLQHIEMNRAAHGAWTLEIVHGAAPHACAVLPCPDRIFVGGSLSGEREAAVKMLSYLSERLRSGGRMVIACVLLGSLEITRYFFESVGWAFEVRMIQVAEAAPLAGDLRFQGTAQIWLVSADKPDF